jgi:hypothetical protein
MFNLLEYGAKIWNTGNWLTFGKSMKTWNYKLEGWHDQFGTYILGVFPWATTMWEDEGENKTSYENILIDIGLEPLKIRIGWIEN